MTTPKPRPSIVHGESHSYPVLPLRDIVVFPHMIVPLFVGREKSIRALEEGVGSVVDIDNSMKLGCGYPMGPFALLDFVGLDTTYYISQIMFDEFKEKRFAAPPLLKRMVLAGWNGKKSGRGFYDYSDSANPKAMSL